MAVSVGNGSGDHFAMPVPDVSTAIPVQLGEIPCSGLEYGCASVARIKRLRVTGRLNLAIRDDSSLYFPC